MKKHKKIYKILLIVFLIVLVTGCEKIDNVDFNAMCIKCGKDVYFPVFLVKLVANLVEFVKIMVPVAIIIVGMIELVKAVIAGEEKQMSESKDKLIRKFVSGIMIFLVFAVVQFLFTVIPNFTDDDFDVMECMAQFINGPEKGKACPSRVVGEGKSIQDDEEGYKPTTTPVKKSGTLSNCWGRNQNDCTTNDYYECDWYYECGKCGPEDKNPCDAKCWRCEKDGVVKYKWDTQAPYSYCKSKTSTTNGQPIDKTNCVPTQEEKENNKNNGKCYKCNYGNGVVYEWRANNKNSSCVEVKDDKKNSEETCINSGEKKETDKKCWYCKNNKGYYFQESNPNINECDVVDELDTKSKCNKNYVTASNNGGYCWDCGKGRMYFGWDDDPDIKKLMSSCKKTLLKEDDCKVDPKPYCWYCKAKKTKKAYTLWRQNDPSIKKTLECENVTEPEFQYEYKCTTSEYESLLKKNEQEEKDEKDKIAAQKKNYGHCYYCTNGGYYWCGKGLNAPTTITCGLYDISEYDCRVNQQISEQIYGCLN